MQPTLDQQVEQLAAWTEVNKPAPEAQAVSRTLEGEMALAAEP
jgi:hypothetical protein